MPKICLIRQPAGLGDILFCQKIAQHFKDQGYDIIWPVIKEFCWVKNYIEDVNFPLVTKDFFKKDVYVSQRPIYEDNFIFLPLQDADQIYPYMLIFEAKYKMAGISYESWHKFINIKRNIQKENDLYLKLNPKNEPYFFINKYYGSPPGYKTIDYIPKFNIKTIENSFYDDFTVFDWLKILENAKEIHSVDTCLSCIIEGLLTIKGSLYLYSRYNPKSFHQTQSLYSKNWNFVL